MNLKRSKKGQLSHSCHFSLLKNVSEKNDKDCSIVISQTGASEHLTKKNLDSLSVRHNHIAGNTWPNKNGKRMQT